MPEGRDFLGHEKAYRGAESVARRDGVKVILLGAGALGSWLVDLLARQGYNSITVVDRERVDNDNYGTQNYGRTDAARPKATQASQNVFRRIGVRVEGIVKTVTETTIEPILRGQHLVVDLFDNAESRELVRVTCERLGIPCLHAGMGTMGYFEVIWNERYKVAFGHDEDPNAPCDYPMSSNLVMLCVGATAEVINTYIDDGKKIDVDFWLAQMKMNKYEFANES